MDSPYQEICVITSRALPPAMEMSVSREPLRIVDGISFSMTDIIIWDEKDLPANEHTSRFCMPMNRLFLPPSFQMDTSNFTECP